MIIFSATYTVYTHMADKHFSPQNNLSLATLCSPQHFTLHILLPGTQFAPQNTLLPRSLCFLANFAFWTTLLLGTWSKLFQGAKCAQVQSVLKSKVFWGVKCDEKESELGCKVYHGT